MGNETNPVNIICQVEISNPMRHPAIALVIPELNRFKELQGGVSDDDLYQNISYTRPDLYPQTNSSIMRYSFQIYPKIVMNRTMLRCGVALIQQNGRLCWGEQVVLIQYDGITNPTTSTPTPCTMPRTSEVTTTADKNMTDTDITSDQSTGSVSVGQPLSSGKRNGIIVGAVLGFVVIAVAVVALLVGVLQYMWKSRHPSRATTPA